MPSLKHQPPHRPRPRAGSKNHARRLDPVSQASCVVSSRRHCSKRQHQEQIEIQSLNRHYDSNQQYSITAVSDGGGSVVERYAYSAYGQVTIFDDSRSQISNSEISNRYTYTGREWDEGLSLYHYRAKMYDAVSGRFVSRDPIGFEGSRYSLYEYVSGMPLVVVDPTGLQGFGFTACCNGIEYNIAVQGCCDGKVFALATECCENKAIVAKVSIWICKRPLDIPKWGIGTGLQIFPTGWALPQIIRTNHLYVCCDGANRTCYGKQSTTNIGDIIPIEPLQFGKCKEHMVCPSVKDSKCSGNNVSTKPYGLVLPGYENCHDWALEGCNITYFDSRIDE